MVKEASSFCNLMLGEDLESYLVFLLMRYTQSTTMIRKTIAIDFLEAAHKIGKNRNNSLQEVGDSCLLFAGLFPGVAQRRNVRVSYFVKIGKTAYYALSLANNVEIAPLFCALSENFVPLMDILQSMREIDSKIDLLDAMTAEEIWRDTGSQHALKALKKFTNIIPIGHINKPNFKK